MTIDTKVADEVRRLLDNYTPSPQKSIELNLTDAYKAAREYLENWIRTNVDNDQSMKSLVSNEKLFDINGVYKILKMIVSGQRTKKADFTKIESFREKSFYGCLSVLNASYLFWHW
jgi:hypothetical protein